MQQIDLRRNQRGTGSGEHFAEAWVKKKQLICGAWNAWGWWTVFVTGKSTANLHFVRRLRGEDLSKSLVYIQLHVSRLPGCLVQTGELRSNPM